MPFHMLHSADIGTSNIKVTSVSIMCNIIIIILYLLFLQHAVPVLRIESSEQTTVTVITSLRG